MSDHIAVEYAIWTLKRASVSEYKFSFRIGSNITEGINSYEWIEAFVMQVT